MENYQYRTIESESEGFFRDRGSKFLAFAFPASSEEQIRVFLEDLRKHYRDARHHCYAWRLGADGENYRANDDGEPSGTAGKPILGQIQKFELTNILVVVVRYFGGTLLGTGGLINAYRTATESALENSSIIIKTVEEEYQLIFPYDAMNDVMKVLKEEQAQQLSRQFDLSCSLTIRIPVEGGRRVEERLKLIDKVIVNKLSITY